MQVTLNRPAARNAVNHDVATGIEAAIDELEQDDDLWAGVLAGNGPVFCAGADLKEVAAGCFSGLRTERGGFARLVNRERTKTLIAALAGDALAGGMEIAIACDLLVAGDQVRLGLPEAARSLLAVGGGLAELPRLIGEKAALELAITATPWPAQRLAALGLISRVVSADSVLDEAHSLARMICRNAPLAVRAARQVIVSGRDLDTAARWALADQKRARISDTNDYLEGPRAFLEKREPRWSAG